VGDDAGVYIIKKVIIFKYIRGNDLANRVTRVTRVTPYLEFFTCIEIGEKHP